MPLNDRRAPIVAIATASGRGAVGIVRLSGANLQPLAQALTGRVLRPRYAHYGPFLDDDGRAIDQGLALFFPAPHSYTGEDVLELQAHGGAVVLQLLLARCLRAAQQIGPQGQPLLPQLRMARPGEFTERAFLHGKLDLAQAEAVADLIDASTEAAARSAARSLAGAFSAQVQVLRQDLMHLRMLVEATLDFPEEEIDHLRSADAHGQLQKLQQQVAATLAQTRCGALLREGLRVVIAGQPNAGKSSLLNALAGAELAIVTPLPGTTRDRIAQTIQIEGVPLHLTDTAGLRHSEDAIERLGVARSWEAIASADVVLFLHDLTRHADPAYQAADADIQRELGALGLRSVPRLAVWNKSDSCAALPPALADASDPDTLVLSVRSGAGLDALRQRLLALAGWQADGAQVGSARARHVQGLQACAQALASAQAWLQAQPPVLELLAEELRLAQRALDTLTGQTTADDLLGAIFTQFCIGK